MDETLRSAAQQVIAESKAEERAALKMLRPSECATALRVTGEFIRGEIHDGRLLAHVFERPSGRRVYRIRQQDFDAYLERHWPAFHAEQQAS